MRICSFLFSVFFTSLFINCHAQFYTAGETSGWQVATVESEYIVGGSMSFSIGCDSADVWISSTRQAQFTWARLSLALGDSVYVSYRQGLVAHYLHGEQISIADTTWTHNFDFIWGNGGMGQYGTNTIDSSYLAFRKINGMDTSYIFIKVSTRDNAFKVHQVISACAVNPISIISDIEDLGDDALHIYPNPVTSELKIDYAGNFIGSIVNMQGSVIQLMNNSNKVNVEALPTGVYVLCITTNDGRKAFRRFIKN